MLGTLYLITNTVNDFKYVGKTYKDLTLRWREHCRAVTKYPNRPLYSAMNKLGIDKFAIEPIGYYPEGILEIKEIETIERYDSFRNGYNATLGGEGRTKELPSKELILRTFQIEGRVHKTAEKLKTDHRRVSKFLKEEKINTKTGERPVTIVELNLKFESITKCADFLLKEGLTTNKYARNKIYDVLQGRRNKYLKYTFNYGD